MSSIRSKKKKKIQQNNIYNFRNTITKSSKCFSDLATVLTEPFDYPYWTLDVTADFVQVEEGQIDIQSEL